ncbi:MAG TPA: hypothetical protein VGP07_11755 [Polyangia bacterium]
MTAAEKTAFLDAIKDADFRDQVRALLHPVSAVRKAGTVGMRFIDENGVHDEAADEARRADRAAERARIAALPPAPSLRRRASEAIDLTAAGRWGSDV